MALICWIKICQVDNSIQFLNDLGLAVKDLHQQRTKYKKEHLNHSATLQHKTTTNTITTP